MKNKRYSLKYCQQRTEYTKRFYVVLDDENRQIGMPIEKRAQAIAIVEFLNSVNVDEYLDPDTLTFRLDIY